MKQQLEIMLRLAANGHAGQFDKGGNPYLLHPIAVMHLLDSDVRDNEDYQCVAVGHDLFEDTKITIQDMRNEGINENVIEAITLLTKMPGQSYEEYKKAVKSNRISRKVKKADLKHNSDVTRLKGVGEKDKARTARYMEFYHELSLLD